MFNPRNAVDLDTQDRAIPPGMGVVKGSEGERTFATVYLHPSNVAKYLPAPPACSERERTILGYMGYKSGYRRECLARMQPPCEPVEIDSLVERGFVSRNRAGATSLTTEGRNARQGANY